MALHRLQNEYRAHCAARASGQSDLSSGKLADDAPIKKDLNANFYDLVGPIMTIENFFRTLLQDELARYDLSVDLIVDNLIGRQNGAADFGAGNDCACAA